MESNLVSDLNEAERKFRTYGDVLRKYAGKFLREDSVNSLMSNVSDAGYISIDSESSENYDNVQPDGNLSQAPSYSSSAIDVDQLYDNAYANANAKKPVSMPISFHNPFYGYIQEESEGQDTYGDARLIQKNKEGEAALKKLFEEKKRQYEETKLQLLKKMTQASFKPTQEPQPPQPSGNTSTEPRYSTGPFNSPTASLEDAEELLRLTSDLRSQEEQHEKYMSMVRNAPPSPKLPSRDTKPALASETGGDEIMIAYGGYDPVVQAPNYTHLKPKNPLQVSTNPYDTLAPREFTERGVLDSAILFETTRVTTLDEGIKSVEEFLKLNNSISAIIRAREALEIVHKRFKVSGGVNGYYESAGPRATSTYETPDLHDDLVVDHRGYVLAAPLPPSQSRPKPPPGVPPPPTPPPPPGPPPHLHETSSEPSKEQQIQLGDNKIMMRNGRLFQQQYIIRQLQVIETRQQQILILLKIH